MSKNFFNPAFLGNGLSRFALNYDPVQLMESARASAEPPTDPVINNNPEPAAQTNDNVPSDPAPEQILEGKDGKEWTVDTGAPDDSGSCKSKCYAECVE